MLKARLEKRGLGVRVLAAGAILCAGFAAFGEPANLARDASITANSEYSGGYVGRGVADGVIPGEGSHDDVGMAWCVQGETHRNGAELVFAWQAEVGIAEVVYYARTAWMLTEAWRDYAVHIDDAAEPVVTGTFAMVHGAQRIPFAAPVRCRKLTLRFLSSYGGANPGASEILVLDERPSDRYLARLTQPGPEPPDAVALARLIARLGEVHGNGYATRAEHERRLGEAAGLSDGDARAAALERLCRDVLLFDTGRLLAIRRHEIAASHVYTYHYEGFRAGGGLYVVDISGDALSERELVATPEGQILDCDLSYDGRTVLFSWRRRQEEPYHLWRIGIDGTGLTQLTDGPRHDYNACWLPDGGIAFLCTRSPQFAYCWHAPVGTLHRMDADGGNLQTLSANYLNDFTPYVLDDGRIVYSRWEYVDKPAIPIQSLWTINPDGTGLSMYFGNGILSPGTFMDTRQVPGTETVLCTMTGHNGPTRGAIGLIDRRQGLNDAAAIRNLTPDTPIPQVNEGNGNTDGSKPYSCPQPLDSVRFLVSAKGPALVRNLAGDCVSAALPYPDGGMQWFNVQPVRPRRRPPVISPAALDAAVASRGEAVLFVRDVYRGLEPEVRRGDVARLRVVREMPKTVRIDPAYRAFGFQFPVISCGATYAGKQVLGEVPVAADGSACFTVPAGVPIYFMALDREGRAVQRMRSFTHLMPGETQGCVGCHEHRLSTAPPKTGLPLAVTPVPLEPPEWGTEGFDYSRVVQPVLDRYCADCHEPRKAPGGVDLTGDKTDYFSVSYETLARDRQGPEGSPYVSWIPTYNGHEQNILRVKPLTWGSPRSRLAEVVLGGHPDKDGKPRVAVDEVSRRRVLAWIDLNVPYYGSSETAYPEAPGCRRLYPEDLDKTLAGVAARRCGGCHTDGAIPRREWVRITRPELNPFLLAPLAVDAGGTGRCGKAVFASADDPDYRAILAAFDSVGRKLAERPRMDMPGGQPAPEVCRDTY